MIDPSVHPSKAIKTIYDPETDTIHQLKQMTIMGEYKPKFDELPPENQTWANARRI